MADNNAFFQQNNAYFQNNDNAYPAFDASLSNGTQDQPVGQPWNFNNGRIASPQVHDQTLYQGWHATQHNNLSNIDTAFVNPGDFNYNKAYQNPLAQYQADAYNNVQERQYNFGNSGVNNNGDLGFDRPVTSTREPSLQGTIAPGALQHQQTLYSPSTTTTQQTQVRQCVEYIASNHINFHRHSRHFNKTSQHRMAQKCLQEVLHLDHS